MSSELIRTEAYRQLISELKDKVRSAQIKAALAVNAQLIELYWDIGRLITERQEASGWGDNVITEIARDLTHD